jgi:integrase
MAIKGFARWLSDNVARPDESDSHVLRSPLEANGSPAAAVRGAGIESALLSERCPRDRAILPIALYGGLRAQEICNLKRVHFVPEHGLVGFMGKGRKQRSVALPKQALGRRGGATSKRRAEVLTVPCSAGRTTTRRASAI